MTTAATARHLVHRAACARTLADLLAIGDRYGLDRSLPPARYLRAFQRRHAAMAHLATTMPYRAGWYGMRGN